MKFSFRRVGRRPLIVAVVGAVLVMVSSTAAYADVTIKMAVETTVVPPLDGNCVGVSSPGHLSAGTACFVAKGDHFYIRDDAAEGDWIRMSAYMRTDTDTAFRCEDHLGKAAGWTECSFPNRIPEDSQIVWWLNVFDGDQGVSRSDYKVSDTSN